MGWDRVVITGETVTPFCAPGYPAVHVDTLNGPVTGWGGLTFLDLARPGQGRATWERWFEVGGRPAHGPWYENFYKYVHALDAAVTGQGIVLGWRHLGERHVEAGALIARADGFAETGRCFHAVPTDKGRQMPQVPAFGPSS